MNITDDTEKAIKLLAGGYSFSAHPVSRALPGTQGPEIELRDGGKWETLRTYDVRMNASSLRKPRLDLAYIARRGGVLESTAAPLDFSLVVTIRGPSKLRLYDDVRAEFPVLVPVEVAVAGQIET